MGTAGGFFFEIFSILIEGEFLWFEIQIIFIEVSGSFRDFSKKLRVGSMEISVNKTFQIISSFEFEVGSYLFYFCILYRFKN